MPYKVKFLFKCRVENMVSMLLFVIFGKRCAESHMSYDFVVFDNGRGHICLHRETSEIRSGRILTAHALYYYFRNNYVIFSFPRDPTELALHVCEV